MQCPAMDTWGPAVAPAAAPGAFGVYLHWPFCLSKCPYCDFNSHVRAHIDQDRWRQALITELRHYAALTPGRTVSSIFFGGGTPSLMAPETAAAAIDEIARLWDLAPDPEITLEANPTSVEAGRFAAFRDAGINRVSIGVQSLDDAALAFLGRRHSAAEALAAVELAARTFPRFSFDLIYALPGQSRMDWRDQLRRALAFGPRHLSVYQLTLEAGTAFHGAWRRGELAPADAETAADLYETTQDILGAAGRPAYEVSNHAAPGAECRHNLIYWQAGDYVGVGPGAHGRLTLPAGRTATRQHRAPEIWLETVLAQGHATRQDALVPPAEQLTELLMMGLRLTDGVARTTFRRALMHEPEDLIDRAKLESLIAADYLVLDAAGLRTTDVGRMRLDSILRYLCDES